MKNSSILLAAAVMAFLLATCGDDTVAPDETVPTTSPGSTVPVGTPSGIEGEEPGTYTGFLFADETGVYLVKTLAESYPPQAVGPLRPVEGIDLETFPGLSSAQGITWSDQPVELTGTIVDGVLVLSS